MPETPETPAPETSAPTILIIGASRGLGHALAAEFLARDWNVIGTVRGGQTPLHELAGRFPGRLDIETLDINEPAQLAALRERLSGRSLDMLFVNAGTTIEDTTGLRHLAIGPWAGLGVLALWTAAALVTAALTLRLRDT